MFHGVLRADFYVQTVEAEEDRLWDEQMAAAFRLADQAREQYKHQFEVRQPILAGRTSYLIVDHLALRTIRSTQG